ncbi:MAG: metallophosphoesterase family protein [Anaerolineae bacterium]
MKIAVISDIHGNMVAFEAVITDLRQQSVDHIICLGDAIQGGPQPAQVTARLRELNCPVVLGNADDWLLLGDASLAEPVAEHRRHKLNLVRDWQLTQLSKADIAFIQSFTPSIELELGAGRKLLGYHGSPRSFDDKIFPLTPDDEVRVFLNPQDNFIYCGGHTHVQFIRHFGRTFHFNPGSVGLPWRHDQPEQPVLRADPWAEYAILTVSGAQIGLEFRRVPFDVATLLNAYRTGGHPLYEDALIQYGG